MTTYPAHGWLPPGAKFDWQHADQGRDFVTNWRGRIQAPGRWECVDVWSDRAFPSGFGPRYPIIRILDGPFARGAVGSPGNWNGEWYIGHCTSVVHPGEQGKFGDVLAIADQGHDFAGTSGGWVELGTKIGNFLGPMSSSGHWFDSILRTPLVTGGISMKAVDHSNGGAIIGGALKANGVQGILRYACEGRSDVNISHAEADDLKAHGIPIAIFCEHATDFLLGGSTVGARRARGSRDVTRAAGLPDGVIYMAADWDCTNGGPTSPGSPGDHNMRQILDTLKGTATEIGADNTGFYGSSFAIDWLVHNAPWIKWYCQTEAWSMGQLHPRANVLQRATSTNIGGVDCDNDVILTRNWGQRGAQAPAPPPPPKPIKRASGKFRATIEYDHDAGKVTTVGTGGDVKSWGDIDETILFEVGLNVGPKRGVGEWPSRLTGARGR